MRDSTGLIAMPEPSHKTKELADLYKHPYGGVARDVWVTKEQFARFFGVSIMLVESLPTNVKVFDVLEPGCELLGYVIQDRRQRRLVMNPMGWVFDRHATIEYKIVIIDRRNSAWVKYHNQETDKFWRSLEHPVDENPV